MGALGPGWSEGSRWGMAASLACRKDVRAKAVAPGAGELPRFNPAHHLNLQEGPFWELGSEVVLPVERSGWSFQDPSQG